MQLLARRAVALRLARGASMDFWRTCQPTLVGAKTTAGPPVGQWLASATQAEVLNQQALPAGLRGVSDETENSRTGCRLRGSNALPLPRNSISSRSERDATHWSRKRLKELLENIAVDGPEGGLRQILRRTAVPKNSNRRSLLLVAWDWSGENP